VRRETPQAKYLLHDASAGEEGEGMRGYFSLSAIIGIVIATIATAIGLVWKFRRDL
tara:strand:+ start:520 stop:687 length:168 start_codon:yes stop_codon:yes gene_type:complete